MSRFTDELTVTHVRVNGLRRHVIVESGFFGFAVGDEDSEEVIQVPRGFRSNGSSQPWFLWSLLGGPFGDALGAGLIHDYLYRTAIYSRADSDLIFREALIVDGVSKVKAELMYEGVHWRGQNAWENNARLRHIYGLEFQLGREAAV